MQYFYSVHEVYRQLQIALLFYDAVIMSSQPIHIGEDTPVVEADYASGVNAYKFISKFYNFNPVFGFKITRQDFKDIDLRVLTSILQEVPVYENSSLIITDYECSKNAIEFEGDYYRWCDLYQLLNEDFDDIPDELELILDEWLQKEDRTDLMTEEEVKQCFHNKQTICDFLNTPPTDFPVAQVILNSLASSNIFIRPIKLDIEKLYTSNLTQIEEISSSGLDGYSLRIFKSMQEYRNYLEQVSSEPFLYPLIVSSGICSEITHKDVEHGRIYFLLEESVKEVQLSELENPTVNKLLPELKYYYGLFNTEETVLYNGIDSIYPKHPEKLVSHFMRSLITKALQHTRVVSFNLTPSLTRHLQINTIIDEETFNTLNEQNMIQDFVCVVNRLLSRLGLPGNILVHEYVESYPIWHVTDTSKVEKIMQEGLRIQEWSKECDFGSGIYAIPQDLNSPAIDNILNWVLDSAYENNRTNFRHSFSVISAEYTGYMYRAISNYLHEDYLLLLDENNLTDYSVSYLEDVFPNIKDLLSPVTVESFDM